MSDTAIWFIAVERPGLRAEWDWPTLGAPDPQDLLPTRSPSSGDFSRHIPVSAYSMTTNTHHELESGLEHDLFKDLDRRRGVVHLVAQPVVLHFPGTHPGRAPRHTPDLLSLHADGSVTVWDARPPDRHDELFEHKSKLTAAACRDVGWTYEVFSGHRPATRMNLLWLSGFKRSEPWHSSWSGELCELLSRESRPLGAVIDNDDGTGELISTMWHLIWTGAIACDLERQIAGSTALTWNGR